MNNNDEVQEITSDVEPKFYHLMPNMAEDDLGPYAYRLYGHYRRVAGEQGAGFERSQTTAEKCRMSRSKMIATRNELAKAGYIAIEERRKEDGSPNSTLIKVINIWEKNIKKYGGAVHLMDGGRPLQKQGRPSGGRKEESLEEKPEEENELPPRPIWFALYEQEIEGMTPLAHDTLLDLIEDYTEAWVIDAIKEARISGVRKIKYIKAILKNWKAEGRNNGKTTPELPPSVLRMIEGNHD